MQKEYQQMSSDLDYMVTKTKQMNKENKIIIGLLLFLLAGLVAITVAGVSI